MSPLAIFGSKFFMNLTLPQKMPSNISKTAFCKSIDKTSMSSANLQLHILDNTFFSGLEEVFQTQLLQTFQTFCMSNKLKRTYIQNQAPIVDEEDPVPPSPSGTDEVIDLDWTSVFTQSYVPAVNAFLKTWVLDQKQVFKDPYAAKLKNIWTLKAYQMIICPHPGFWSQLDFLWSLLCSGAYCLKISTR